MTLNFQHGFFYCRTLFQHLLASAALTLLVVGCQSTRPWKLPPEATRVDIAGVWIGYLDRAEFFSEDGKYCAYALDERDNYLAWGTWSFDDASILAINLKASSDPKDEISHVGYIRRVFRVDKDTMLMGPPCDHCELGIAGSYVTRATGSVEKCEPRIR